MHRLWHISFVMIASLFFIIPLYAEDPKLPQAILLPWEGLGVTSEDSSSLKDELDAIFDHFKRNLIKGAVSLQDILPKDISLNRAQKAKTMFGGERAFIAGATQTLVVEPVWCKLADHYVFQVQVSNIDTDAMLAASHVAISSKELMELRSEKGLSSRLETAASHVVTSLKNALQDKRDDSQNSALHLGFALAKESNRYDLGSMRCMLQLMGEELAGRYQIERNVGGENIHFIRDVFGVSSKLLRKTRTVNVDFDALKVQDEAPYYLLPQKFNTRLSFSESVLGSPIAYAKAFVSELTVTENQRLRLQVDDQLQIFLDRQGKTLDLNDKPQVVKITGAWVYLDRGRAFGLKINDRLVVQGASEEIKGHVVGFFGPQLKLTSPRGFVVEEGAIVYIRKGQQMTEVGQLLEYDQTKYPTMWPPSARAE